MNALKENNVVERFSELAEELKESYMNASPYQHCCIDGLFDEQFLEGIVRELEGDENESSWKAFEQKDRSHNKVISSINGLVEAGGNTKTLVSILTSSKFITALEKLTGIQGLIVDPHFYNSGYHVMKPGGFLKIHRDFYYHNQLKLYRRLNLILYLNDDWKEEYGGYLELLDKNLENSVRYYPNNNRIVVSTVTADSLHGNPEPLNCPEGVTRKSFAFWYFTSDLPEDELIKYELSPEANWYDQKNADNRVSDGTVWQILPPIIRDLLVNPITVLRRFVPPMLVRGIMYLKKKAKRAKIQKQRA